MDVGFEIRQAESAAERAVKLLSHGRPHEGLLVFRLRATRSEITTVTGLDVADDDSQVWEPTFEDLLGFVAGDQVAEGAAVVKRLDVLLEVLEVNETSADLAVKRQPGHGLHLPVVGRIEEVILKLDD